MAAVEKANEGDDLLGARIGYARHRALPVEGQPRLLHLHRVRALLGQLPGARRTGKLLSPKQLTLAPGSPRAHKELALGQPPTARPPKARRVVAPEAEVVAKPRPTGTLGELVPNVIDPDVLWACTTCRACEEQCPVNITLRRQDRADAAQPGHDQGRVPEAARQALRGHGGERQPVEPGARRSRALGRRGSSVATLHGQARYAEVLFWVGCAASYDDRAKKIARATAQLLQDGRRGLRDPRRRKRRARATPRAARATSTCSRCWPKPTPATLNGYKEQGGIRSDPHDLPALLQHAGQRVPGLRREVRGGAQRGLFAGITRRKQACRPSTRVKAKITYHDSCRRPGGPRHLYQRDAGRMAGHRPRHASRPARPRCREIVAGDGMALIRSVKADPGTTRNAVIDLDLATTTGEALPVRFMHRVSATRDESGRPEPHHRAQPHPGRGFLRRAAGPPKSASRASSTRRRWRSPASTCKGASCAPTRPSCRCSAQRRRSRRRRPQGPPRRRHPQPRPRGLRRRARKGAPAQADIAPIDTVLPNNEERHIRFYVNAVADGTGGEEAPRKRRSSTPSTPPSRRRSKARWRRARRCRRSASSPAASRTTSTTC